MADIYLTKIERKTIFTRALIYVLILFVVSDLTITGPFFVNFIPWLYILSILISLRGVDKVLTGIIGTFTVFIASIITNGGVNATTVLYTLNSVIQLGLGMLTSHIIHEFVLEHRLVKYIKPKKKAVLIVLLILLSILSILVVSLVHGDIVTYLKSRNNFDEYISKIYNVEYEIKEVIYNRNLPGKYAYVVEIGEEEIYFAPVLSTAFRDMNQQERLNNMNELIAKKLENSIDNVLGNMKILNKELISVNYEYSKVGIMPDNLIVHIGVNTDETSVYQELATTIIKLVEIESNITEVDIVLNGKNLHILVENIDLVTPEYIEGGFNIEDLDE